MQQRVGIPAAGGPHMGAMKGRGGDIRGDEAAGWYLRDSKFRKTLSLAGPAR